MDEPFRTRAALAEIPFRMGMLRVSTDEMPLALHHLHATIINSPNPNIDINNIPSSYLTPSPSPDELIIRQRGQCCLFFSWFLIGFL